MPKNSHVRLEKSAMLKMRGTISVLACNNKTDIKLPPVWLKATV